MYLKSSIFYEVPIAHRIGVLYAMARANGNDPNDQTKEVLKKLGKRIRALREAKGEMNYEKFAFKHELNRTQLWRYENGEDFNFSSLIKVLKALDVSLADFFKEGFE